MAEGSEFNHIRIHCTKFIIQTEDIIDDFNDKKNPTPLEIKIFKKSIKEYLTLIDVYRLKLSAIKKEDEIFEVEKFDKRKNFLLKKLKTIEAELLQLRAKLAPIRLIHDAKAIKRERHLSELTDLNNSRRQSGTHKEAKLIQQKRNKEEEDSNDQNEVSNISPHKIEKNVVIREETFREDKKRTRAFPEDDDRKASAKKSALNKDRHGHVITDKSKSSKRPTPRNEHKKSSKKHTVRSDNTASTVSNRTTFSTASEKDDRKKTIKEPPKRTEKASPKRTVKASPKRTENVSPKRLKRDSPEESEEESSKESDQDSSQRSENELPTKAKSARTDTSKASKKVTVRSVREEDKGEVTKDNKSNSRKVSDSKSSRRDKQSTKSKDATTKSKTAPTKSKTATTKSKTAPTKSKTATTKSKSPKKSRRPSKEWSVTKSKSDVNFGPVRARNNKKRCNKKKKVKKAKIYDWCNNRVLYISPNADAAADRHGSEKPPKKSSKKKGKRSPNRKLSGSGSYTECTSSSLSESAIPLGSRKLSDILTGICCKKSTKSLSPSVIFEVKDTTKDDFSKRLKARKCGDNTDDSSQGGGDSTKKDQRAKGSPPKKKKKTKEESGSSKSPKKPRKDRSDDDSNSPGKSGKSPPKRKDNSPNSRDKDRTDRNKKPGQDHSKPKGSPSKKPPTHKAEGNSVKPKGHKGTDATDKSKTPKPAEKPRTEKSRGQSVKSLTKPGAHKRTAQPESDKEDLKRGRSVKLEKEKKKQELEERKSRMTAKKRSRTNLTKPKKEGGDKQTRNKMELDKRVRGTGREDSHTLDEVPSEYTFKTNKHVEVSFAETTKKDHNYANNVIENGLRNEQKNRIRMKRKMDMKSEADRKLKLMVNSKPFNSRSRSVRIDRKGGLESRLSSRKEVPHLNQSSADELVFGYKKKLQKKIAKIHSSKTREKMYNILFPEGDHQISEDLSSTDDEMTETGWKSFQNRSRVLNERNPHKKRYSYHRTRQHLTRSSPTMRRDSSDCSTDYDYQKPKRPSASCYEANAAKDYTKKTLDRRFTSHKSHRGHGERLSKVPSKRVSFRERRAVDHQGEHVMKHKTIRNFDSCLKTNHEGKVFAYDEDSDVEVHSSSRGRRGLEERMY